MGSLGLGVFVSWELLDGRYCREEVGGGRISYVCMGWVGRAEVLSAGSVVVY